MKIINETNWDTKCLKKILTVCLAEVRRREGRENIYLKPKRIKVHCKKAGSNQHSRDGFVTGRAHYWGSDIYLWIPSIKMITHQLIKTDDGRRVYIKASKSEAGSDATYKSTWNCLKDFNDISWDPKCCLINATRSIAFTFIHELGHCMGFKHQNIKDVFGRKLATDCGERVYREWVAETIGEDFILTEKIPYETVFSNSNKK